MDSVTLKREEVEAAPLASFEVAHFGCSSPKSPAFPYPVFSDSNNEERFETQNAGLF